MTLSRRGFLAGVAAMERGTPHRRPHTDTEVFSAKKTREARRSRCSVISISAISLERCHFDRIASPNVIENVRALSLEGGTVNGEARGA